MPTSLQNLIKNLLYENMLLAWVCMDKKTCNHVNMVIYHELNSLKSIDLSIYMYVKKSLQLSFNGL